MLHSTKRYRQSWALLALTVTVAGPTIGVAQQAAPPRIVPQPATTTAQPAQWQSADQLLATCVAICNETEVELAKFAKERADSKAVAEFAAMMEQDHSAFLKQLGAHSQDRKPLTTSPAATPSARNSAVPKTSAAAPEANRATGSVNTAAGVAEVQPGQIQQTAGQTTVAAQRGNQRLDIIALEREVAQQCLASAKEELSQKEGKQFDQCFVGLQIASHAMMVDKLTVYQKHVSPELQQTFAEGLKTTKSHLEHAKELMQDLDSHGASDGQKQGNSNQK